MVETHPKRRDRGNDLSLSGKRGWWTDGLAPTLAAVRNKLEQPLALGYCQVGVVVAVGEGRGEQLCFRSSDFSIMDVPMRLVSQHGVENGQQFPHTSDEGDFGHLTRRPQAGIKHL